MKKGIFDTHAHYNDKKFEGEGEKLISFVHENGVDYICNVGANIKESMEDATVIVVAQRVSTIMDATRIIVLENGEVAGMGTHRELLKSCKLYREIAEIQLGKEEVDHELECN